MLQRSVIRMSLNIKHSWTFDQLSRQTDHVKKTDEIKSIRISHYVIWIAILDKIIVHFAYKNDPFFIWSYYNIVYIQSQFASFQWRYWQHTHAQEQTNWKAPCEFDPCLRSATVPRQSLLCMSLTHWSHALPSSLSGPDETSVRWRSPYCHVLPISHF